MTTAVEISKQVDYVLLGSGYSLAVTKQLDYALMVYPYINVSKQVDYALLEDHEIQVGKQVIYALLVGVTPPPAGGQRSQGYIF